MTDQLAPDAAQIRLHLEILFSDLDARGPYPNGLFELRFLPPQWWYADLQIVQLGRPRRSR